MIHDDGIMDVMMEGQVVRRRFSINVASDLLGRPQPTTYEPEIYDGEMVMWSVGSDIPTIIKTRSADGPDYQCQCCGPSLRDLLGG